MANGKVEVGKVTGDGVSFAPEDLISPGTQAAVDADAKALPALQAGDFSFNRIQLYQALNPRLVFPYTTDSYPPGLSGLRSGIAGHRA